MSRRRGPQPAGGSIRAFAESLAPVSTLGEVQRVWAQAVGAALAAQAEPTGEAGGVVTVTCASAVWAQEIDLMSADLVARLNAALGTARVTGLRCQSVPSRGWSRARR